MTSNFSDFDFSLSEEDIDERKRWLALSALDEDLIVKVKSALQSELPSIIESLYEHFFSLEETRAYFPTAEVLQRAKSAQYNYFLRLCEGNYDADYVLERLKVGSTHHRIGLDPKYYLGAYSNVLVSIAKALKKHFANQDDYLSTLSALSKVIFFDMGLAIDNYIQAKEFAIRKHQSEVQQLEMEKRVTKDILQNAPVGIVRLNSNLCCTECNDEFSRIVDIESREQIINQHIADMLEQIDTEELEKVLKYGQSYSRNALRFAFAGNSRVLYLDLAAWPVSDSTTTSIMLMLTDASDRVRIAQQREDFVATLTHDLKTPILAANRALKLFMDGDFGQVSSTQEKVLETIYQSNDELYKLVLTLLDVYRYDSGAKQLQVSDVNLQELVMQILEGFRPLSDAKKITLELQFPDLISQIRCDQHEIRRVIQNLLDNSLKFTLSHGSIMLTLRQTAKETTISVTDTGKGISDEDKPKLFERFWQASSSGRYYASTGLGLYLCRRIVELHNGRIKCDSVLGKGSTFSFTIPNNS